MKEKFRLSVLAFSLALLTFGGCDINARHHAYVDTFAGQLGQAWTTGAQFTGHISEVFFDRPQALAIDGTGQLLVSDHRRVRRIIIQGGPAAGGHAVGTVLPFIPPGGNGEPSPFIAGAVRGMAIDSQGNVILSDHAGQRVQKFDMQGNHLRTFGAGGGNDPSNMHIDGPGHIAQFHGPAGIAVDSSDNIFVVDTWNNRIRKITVNTGTTLISGVDPGFVSTFAGSIKSYAEGRGPWAFFQEPVGLAIDSNDVLIVADTWNHLIRYITPQGDTGVYASFKDSWGFRDGEASIARVRLPQFLFFDNDTENLYFTDSDIHAIRVVTRGVRLPVPPPPYGAAHYRGYRDWTISNNRIRPRACNQHCTAVCQPYCGFDCTEPNCFCFRQSYVVSGRLVQTVAGFTGISHRDNNFIGRGHRDGPGDLAMFSSPRGIAVTRAGTIFVADFDNHVIRRITR